MEAVRQADKLERQVVVYNLALLLAHTRCEPHRLHPANLSYMPNSIHVERLLAEIDAMNASSNVASRSAISHTRISQHAGLEFLRGRLYCSKHDDYSTASRAEACFLKVLAVNRRHVDAKICLANLLCSEVWSQSRWPEAKVLVTQVLLLQPHNVLARLMLAEMYHKCLNDSGSAYTALTPVLERGPGGVGSGDIGNTAFDLWRQAVLECARMRREAGDAGGSLRILRQAFLQSSQDLFLLKALVQQSLIEPYMRVDAKEGSPGQISRQKKERTDLKDGQEVLQNEAIYLAGLLASLAPHDAEALRIAAMAMAAQGEHQQAHRLRVQADKAGQGVDVVDDATRMPYEYSLLGPLGSLQ